MNTSFCYLMNTIVSIHNYKLRQNSFSPIHNHFRIVECSPCCPKHGVILLWRLKKLVWSVVVSNFVLFIQIKIISNDKGIPLREFTRIFLSSL